MNPRPDVPEVHLDFNGPWHEGLLVAGRDDPELREGAEVLLCDAEGNSCFGVVRRVETRTLLVEADLESWRNGPDSPADIPAGGLYGRAES